MNGDQRPYARGKPIAANSLRAASILLRIGIGILLVYAGLSKAKQPHDFLGAVYEYQLIGPPYGRFVALTLPQMEIVIGCLLLIGVAVRGAFLAAALLGLVFVAVQAAVMWRKLTVHCGCFGSAQDDLVGGATLARAAVIVVLSFLGFCLASRVLRLAKAREVDATGMCAS